ncbi:MAG TPA: hypothetical protein PLV42_03920 [bacterium]|nr:hypothetical protein [bacterium]
MRMIGMLIALMLSMLLIYYYVTGAWPGSSAKKENALERASKEAQVEGGPISSGKEAKERVEAILKKQEEDQKKMIEEASK